MRTMALIVSVGLASSQLLADSPGSARESGSAPAAPRIVGARQITRGPQHHFFGYIGHVRTIPWNASGRYIAGLRTTFQHRMPSAGEAADVILIDTRASESVRVVDRTRAWNFQQGTMLYWNPEAPETQLFFNDRDPETGKIFSVLFDISRGERGERVREYRFDHTPVASGGVRQQGGAFLGINYARLARLRPVTGYPDTFDWTRGVVHPKDDGVHLVDTRTGEKRLVVSYAQMADAIRAQRPDVDEIPLFINHTLWSREGDRVYFYARGGWNKRFGGKRIDVPFTVESDGSGLTTHRHCGGHPEWDAGRRIIGKLGREQVIYDTTRQEPVGKLGDPEIFPSPGGDVALSPDARWFVNGYRTNKGNRYVIYRRSDGAFVRTRPFPYGPFRSGELRIDPSPAWNRDGTRFLFCALSATGDGTRQIWVVEIDKGIE